MHVDCKHYVEYRPRALANLSDSQFSDHAIFDYIQTSLISTHTHLFWIDLYSSYTALHNCMEQQYIYSVYLYAYVYVYI